MTVEHIWRVRVDDLLNEYNFVTQANSSGTALALATYQMIHVHLLQPGAYTDEDLARVCREIMAVQGPVSMQPVGPRFVVSVSVQAVYQP